MSFTAYLLVFVTVFIISAVIKLSFTVQKQAYKVSWTGEIETDVKYGKGEGNTFDLYLPDDKSRESYGLVVYLHAGSFTSGDKKDDAEVLKWLCSKGYVAAGVNYTLSTNRNGASVYDQSLDIKTAMPKVVAKAEKLGYKINGMAIAGGSAGGTLALLYALRDAKNAPVPVKMVFEQVAPASFVREDWTNYGLDKDAKAAAGMFSPMAGKLITPEDVESGAYLTAVKNISADMWVTEKSVPVLMAYGSRDKICPCATGRRLAAALEKHGVPHDYMEFPHSGHGLQNDDKLYKKFVKKIEEYLENYLPVK